MVLRSPVCGLLFENPLDLPEGTFGVEHVAPATVPLTLSPAVLKALSVPRLRCLRVVAPPGSTGKDSCLVECELKSGVELEPSRPAKRVLAVVAALGELAKVTLGNKASVAQGCVCAGWELLRWRGRRRE
jgi:hypothetical protein